MSTKAWIIFSVIVVVLFGGLIYMSGKNKVDVSAVDENSILSATEQSGTIADHVFGNKDSKVILIEYGDFQCPGCGGAHPNIKRLSEQYKDKVAFVFRNTPLTNIHPNALAAAAAVEAAGLQGKYWEMHNLVFESQNDWKDSGATERTDFFVSLAENAGVKDITRFNEDMASDLVNKKIAFDRALAKKAGVTGTPTFFLNGTMLSEDIVNDAIRNKSDLLEAELKQLLK